MKRKQAMEIIRTHIERRAYYASDLMGIAGVSRFVVLTILNELGAAKKRHGRRYRWAMDPEVLEKEVRPYGETTARNAELLDTWPVA